MARPTIIFEGWRNLPHSYCVWSTMQIGAIVRCGLAEVFFTDLPLAKPDWKPVSGLFDQELERIVNDLSPPPSGLVADAVVRTAHPYIFDDAPHARRTLVQATSEFGVVFDNFVSLAGGQTSLASAAAASKSIVVTCSGWSREGFLRSGAPADRVKVVHLGVDTSVYVPPSQEQRAAARAAFSIPESDFVFLSIGAMTPNKSIDLILTSFGETLLKHPRARLLLKGTDSLFDSGSAIQQALGKLDPSGRGLIKSRLTYIGTPLNNSELLQLYHSADAYLAPYRAEGFCLPVLEAAACGLPAIVTKGGPTDEFTTPAFAVAVRAARTWSAARDYLFLEPDRPSLRAAMLRVMTDQRLVTAASTAGPIHAAKFSWDACARDLMRVAIDE